MGGLPVASFSFGGADASQRLFSGAVPCALAGGVGLPGLG
jgi:hypothetical protein